MATLDELQERYLIAAHAVQAGVAMELNDDPHSGTPKHLRVGISMAVVEHGALARLLIKKGIITDEEYMAELVAGVEDERREYEERLSARYGSKITLV